MQVFDQLSPIQQERVEEKDRDAKVRKETEAIETKEKKNYAAYFAQVKKKKVSTVMRLCVASVCSVCAAPGLSRNRVEVWLYGWTLQYACSCP